MVYLFDMDEQLETRLANIEKLVADNNRILNKMRQSQKNAVYRRAIYWVIIIIMTIASFYFIEPYISSLGAAYGIGSGSSADNTSSTLTNLVQQYQAGQKGN